MMSPAGPLEDRARREAAAHRGSGEGAEDGPPRMCASCLCVYMAGDKPEELFMAGGETRQARGVFSSGFWKITSRDTRGQTTAAMVALAAG